MTENKGEAAGGKVTDRKKSKFSQCHFVRQELTRHNKKFRKGQICLT
jgi:hypothetical protein